MCNIHWWGFGFEPVSPERKARERWLEVQYPTDQNVLFSFFFYISMAGEKPGAPANVLWGLFKFSLLCFFLSFYKSFKVYTAVYKRVCIEMFLVMTDKTSSEMLRLYEALIRDIANIDLNRISQGNFSFILKI